MEKFIPLEKRSKKAQKEYHARERRTWGSMSPVTRTVPNGKAYNRKRIKQEDIERTKRDGSSDVLFLFFPAVFCTGI
ncbi:MAG: hypothetical protein IJ773_13950 [Lachnospiraceae bacterium]|nr:hypothetical protein [Lachnospiraceae bacterium]